MGGAREKHLTPSKGKGLTGKSIQVNAVRIHESTGEVHLHDDNNKRKCSVETSRFWKIWDSFKQDIWDGKTTTVVGKDGQTSAQLTARLANNKLDLDIVLDSIELAPNFKMVDDFVSSSS